MFDRRGRLPGRVRADRQQLGAACRQNPVAALAASLNTENTLSVYVAVKVLSWLFEC